MPLISPTSSWPFVPSKLNTDELSNALARHVERLVDRDRTVGRQLVCEAQQCVDGALVDVLDRRVDRVEHRRDRADEPSTVLPNRFDRDGTTRRRRGSGRVRQQAERHRAAEITRHAELGRAVVGVGAATVRSALHNRARGIGQRSHRRRSLHFARPTRERHPSEEPIRRAGPPDLPTPLVASTARRSRRVELHDRSVTAHRRARVELVDREVGVGIDRFLVDPRAEVVHGKLVGRRQAPSADPSCRLATRATRR